MTTSRLSLRLLSFIGGDSAPVRIEFLSGLNVVYGSSDTGKTFIFESLDFMLGAKKLRAIPESSEYSTVQLDIDSTDGPPFTLSRARAGGSFTCDEFDSGRGQPPTFTMKLSASHSSTPGASLSEYLLRHIGIGNRQLRKNATGQKKSLSYRHVAHLTMVDEERIIKSSSPVLSTHDTENTAEVNAFAFFLSGDDDSAIVPHETLSVRRTRLTNEVSLLQTLLDERRAELASLTSDPAGLREQASRLEASITAASGDVTDIQSKVVSLIDRRDVLVQEQSAIQSRTVFINEQLARFRLLTAYYETDLSRLNAVIEASRGFHDLPEGNCPLCKQIFPLERGIPTHDSFESACASEIKKIDHLQNDLSFAVADFQAEASRLEMALERVAETIEDIQGQLNRDHPQLGVARAELQLLLRSQTAVTRSLSLFEDIEKLETRLAKTDISKGERVTKPMFEPRATTSTTSDFCQVVEDLLSAWKYPGLGKVTFDTKLCDLVIGGKNRADSGKGYRAITHAAFIIGLMKYCRLKSLPHPGFVVLDTPVNPYKGPALTKADKLSSDVKAAFFTDLLADRSGDQFIILENQDPPETVKTQANCYNFTRNHLVGRYGFFPVENT